MIFFVVKMIDYNDQQRQKKWNIVFCYIDIHIFNKNFSSNFEFKYSNERWMKQRQWYLSQSLFFMICILRCFSKYSKLKTQLRKLTNRHKYLIATIQNFATRLLSILIWNSKYNKIFEIKSNQQTWYFDRIWIDLNVYKQFSIVFNNFNNN